MRTGILIPAFWVSFAAVLAAGCGGGGGGGTPPPAPEVPFTSFQDIKPNTTAVISGISQGASGSANTGGITSVTLGSVDTAGSTAKLTYDQNLALSKMNVTTPQSSITFDNSPGNSLSCSSGLCEGSTATASGAAVDARVMGWNYQTFGVWAETPTPTSWLAGAVSVGSPTPGSAVPTTGSATFSGMSIGLWVDNVGNLFGLAAGMTATADFSARSIDFNTSGTQVSESGPAVSAPGLNLSGTLTYAAGTNQFSGSVNSADATLSGTATGRFYGPTAQEIGGVYSLTSPTSVSSMLGAFGGKQ